MKILPSSHPVVCALLAGLFLLPGAGVGQLSGPAVGVVEAGLLFRGLDGEKRVLMVGAHPDDEDTSMLAALALGQGVRTAYLSLNRGEGGQNLIGPELDEGLGIIRTGELLSARSLDGAEQYFTRAFDFGFSKSAAETFGHWPEEEVTRDVTWVLRTFRPHVVISVFTGTPQDGHGQHQAAGIVTRLAFEASGDPAQFTDQLDQGAVAWEPLKLYHLRRGGPAASSTVLVETGRIDPLLGRSHHQIAMESRSRHSSQDMGTEQAPGPRASGALLVASRVSGETDESEGFFAGIDTTLSGLVRAASGNDTGPLLEAVEGFRADVTAAQEALHPTAPERAAPHLLVALAHVQEAIALLPRIPDSPHRTELLAVLSSREERATRALLAAAGVVVDLRADRDRFTPGETFEAEVQVWNGGALPVRVEAADLRLPRGWEAVPVGSALETVAPGEIGRAPFRVTVAPDAEPTRLYFLEEERDDGLYRWPAEPELWGRSGNPPLLTAHVRLILDEGPAVTAVRPASHVGVDKAAGEFRVPLFVVPPVGIEIDRNVMAWPASRTESRRVAVRVSHRPGAPDTGEVTLTGPSGWTVSPAAHPVAFSPGGGEASFFFELRPGPDAAIGPADFHASVRHGEREYRESVAFIDYPHIDPSPLYRPATLTISRISVAVAEGLRVGYVMGPGDGGLEALRDLEVEVESLDSDALRAGAFDGLDVIVLGIRAYEIRTDLIAANERLLDFARSGGTVVVQYNKYEYPEGEFAPFPVAMSRPHDRVTDPDAAVTFLRPDHPLLTTPNRLDASDFQGWVQERGLYFLSDWDPRYVPLLGMADPGEAMNQGALVAARVGEGAYVYTGLALFRQLPAGVPGAYRILANLVSIRGSDL